MLFDCDVAVGHRERERDAYMRLDDDDCLPASVPSVLFSLDSPYIVGALLLTSFI